MGYYDNPPDEDDKPDIDFEFLDGQYKLYHPENEEES